jgi:Mycobacterial 4 TMS phage holin, superfamily IV
VLVWALVAVALHLLDLWLADFGLPHWWQPTAFAAILGVLSAGVWPLIMRFAPPGAVLVLGLGSFLLLGAGVLAISFAVPDVVVANLETAMVVLFVIGAVAGLVSSLLAIDEDELFFRRAARRFRRDGTDMADEPPGVLLLQIDGLGYDTVRRGIRDGDLPTLARWLQKGSHTLTDWHCDWSSQTGASVCGLLHGSNDDILGFRWYEKDRDHADPARHRGHRARGPPRGTQAGPCHNRLTGVGSSEAGGRSPASSSSGRSSPSRCTCSTCGWSTSSCRTGGSPPRSRPSSACSAPGCGR